MRHVFYILLACISIILFAIIRFPVFSLNFNEAGQYWMALGQNHYTPFYSTSQGFSEVIKQNNTYNLDPGGFTYILHFWLIISKNYLWIKLLPFIFFIGFVFYLVKLLQLFCRDNPNLSLLIIPILFVSNALPFYGVLLRAYSMEYFGIVLTLYYLFSIKDPNKFYLKTGVVCAFFLWSRYGFGIHILAIYILSILKFRIFSDIKLFFKNSLYFSIPIIITIIFIYNVTLKHQFIAPTNNPGYTRYIINGDMSRAMKLIWSQLSSYINIPLLVLISVYLFTLNRKLFNTISNFKLILIYFGIYHIINFTLSCFGLYPYSVWSYNSKQYEFFNILGIFFLILLFIDFFKVSKIKVFVIVVTIGSFMAIKKRDLGTDNLLTVLNKYNKKTSLYLSIYNYPTTRYLIEQTMFNSKFDSINTFTKNTIVESGSILIYNVAEDFYSNETIFDSTYIILEDVKIKRYSNNSKVYLKK